MITHKLYQFVTNDFIPTRTSNLFTDAKISRLGHFGLIPVSLFTKIFDSCIGIPSALLATCALGRINSLNNFVFDQLNCAGDVVSDPFNHFMKVINPDYAAHTTIPCEGSVLHHQVRNIEEYAESHLIASNDFFKSQVCSRVTYAVLALAYIIARVADAIFVVPLAICTLLSLGKWSSLNSATCKAMKFPGLMPDLFFCFIKILNPQSIIQTRNSF